MQQSYKFIFFGVKYKTKRNDVVCNYMHSTIDTHSNRYFVTVYSIVYSLVCSALHYSIDGQDIRLRFETILSFNASSQCKFVITRCFSICAFIQVCVWYVCVWVCFLFIRSSHWKIPRLQIQLNSQFQCSMNLNNFNYTVPEWQMKYFVRDWFSWFRAFFSSFRW